MGSAAVLLLLAWTGTRVSQLEPLHPTTWGQREEGEEEEEDVGNSRD